MLQQGKLSPEVAASLLGTTVEKLSPEKKKARRDDGLADDQEGQLALSSQPSTEKIPASQKHVRKNQATLPMHVLGEIRCCIASGTSDVFMH